MEQYDAVEVIKRDLQGLRLRFLDAQKKLRKLQQVSGSAGECDREARYLERQVEMFTAAYRRYFNACSNLLKHRLDRATSFIDNDEVTAMLIEFNLEVDMIGVESDWRDP